MSRRPYYLACGLALALVLVLLNLPERVAVPTKTAIGSLYLPLFGVAGSARQFLGRAAAAVQSHAGLTAENQSLRRENQDLRALTLQGAEALRENNRLRQLLGWQQQSPWKLKPGRVIARDTANWWRTVRIDLGRRDGIRPNQPVLTAEGLIGKTGDVGYAASEVVLIGDPKCRISILVRETGEHGVISAASSGVLDHRMVDLTHLPRNTALKPGQIVATSGLGGVFPAGLPVGAVVDYRSVGYGLYTEARVKLLADTSRLREVMVVLQ